eukprot:CAMPEP_0194346808 /NCGR_PEP_ID=MMETSP0171-20130528/105633_1 /TAXON_ID=218684 /ORGANISM="Corethron pennatum, Strain L29A3" /LENGTH=810 /DNA_ID=CAMNT_0039113975 /DNA_START=182 /DNA_END=2614 /DNA_ORIENTATION=-
MVQHDDPEEALPVAELPDSKISKLGRKYLIIGVSVLAAVALTVGLSVNHHVQAKKKKSGAISETKNNKNGKKGETNNENTEILIVQTGDYFPSNDQKSILIAEPFKNTKLSLFINNTSQTKYEELKWNIKFYPKEDEQWSSDLVDEISNLVDGIVMKGEEGQSSIEYMFKFPGKYTVKVTDKTTNKARTASNKYHLAQIEIRVAYARRDVIDLSRQDWNNYVGAIWELKNLSSEEGQTKYNCKNFYNIDVFTTMHGVNSKNKTCDQIHFGIMQEQAHHAWMTLLEKSLQCVHPSISMPFYNIAKDFHKYYDKEIGIKSMNNSPMFGPEYFGGGHANWEDREDPHDPYYVQDGRFANFPLRQNRTGLCDESSGIFNDEVYLPFCKKIMEEPGYHKEWANPDAERSGFTFHEPRDASAYKYVSARRWYIYGSVGDTSIIPFIPNYAMLATVLTLKNVVEQFGLIAQTYIHGYAHIALSGMWGGGIDKFTKTAATAAVNPNVPILELLKDPGMLQVFAWTDEVTTRDVGCYTCSKAGCELNTDVALSLGCYNAPTFTTPDMKKPQWNEYALRGNEWYKFNEKVNTGSWMKYVLYGFGAHHANSGSFSRSTWANQDPIFYAHHAFTFLVGDIAMKSLEERGISSAPLYGLDMLPQITGVKECPGNNVDDTTIFKNIVRYKSNQELGSEHTWAHMLEMWSPERRDFEWIINDEYITDFKSTLSKDSACVEDCSDTGRIISSDFPDNTDPGIVCETVLSQVQQGFNISKEEACYVHFKDVPGLPDWLPDVYDFMHVSCKITCGYCKPVCEYTKEFN